MIEKATIYDNKIDITDMLVIPNMCNVLYHTTLTQVKPKFKHMGFFR